MDWTRSAVTALLEERGIRLKRSLGQNYLVDSNFLDALVRDAEVGPGDRVVEIGSGLGNLTERLARKAGQVWAFEIDETIHALSRELGEGLGNVAWVCGDGAGFATLPGPGPIRLVSNLPYGDWQRILIAILAAPQELRSCVLMIQTDVYERLKAGPGDDGYGPMSVLVQATGGLRKLRKASPGLFLPAPRVDSTVFRLERPAPVPDAEALAERLQGLFAQRRKKSAAAGGRRVESLPPAELLQIARGP